MSGTHGLRLYSKRGYHSWRIALCTKWAYISEFSRGIVGEKTGSKE